MKAYHLTIAAAGAGLLLAATTPASAAPLSPASSAPLGISDFDGQVEPVHYRRRAYRRHYGGPVISFGLSPYAYASPYYYSRPYGYGYPSRYGYGGYPYGYGYGYGYAPSFSFGFGLR
jgi:hypothetical protein